MAETATEKRVFIPQVLMTTEKAKRLKSNFFRAVQMGPCHFDFWEFFQIHFFQCTHFTWHILRALLATLENQAQLVATDFYYFSITVGL